MNDNPPTVERPRFLFLCCQVGAEAAVKDELEREWPRFRFAYSRPGFLTYKLPAGHDLPADFDLGLVFARCWGFSLGTVRAPGLAELAHGVWPVYGARPCRRVHVWPRDAHPVGEHDFEPSITLEARQAHTAIVKACPQHRELAEEAHDPLAEARRGEMVLDCVLVEPDEWWVGYHRAGRPASRWPGGIPPLRLPPHAVSRGWLKTEEALRWSELPIPRGARVVELGSAPGGASQVLLARGFEVTGIDPAAMHPSVLGEPAFTHLRRRVRQVRRREFRKARWLLADMTVAPQFTLDAVEAIVNHPQVNIRGMLLTLKLLEWHLAAEVPAYLDRIRRWGYNVVLARQLAHNRQEICVAALMRPFGRKKPERAAAVRPTGRAGRPKRQNAGKGQLPFMRKGGSSRDN